MSLFSSKTHLGLKSFIAALSLSLGLSASVMACPGDHYGEGHKHGMKSDRLASKLNLTSEQKDEFRKVMQIQREKKRSFMENQREETRNALSNVLTKEQLQSFDQLMEERRNRKGMNGKKDTMGQGEGRKYRFSE